MQIQFNKTCNKPIHVHANTDMITRLAVCLMEILFLEENVFITTCYSKVTPAIFIARNFRNQRTSTTIDRQTTINK